MSADEPTFADAVALIDRMHRDSAAGSLAGQYAVGYRTALAEALAEALRRLARMASCTKDDGRGRDDDWARDADEGDR